MHSKHRCRNSGCRNNGCRKSGCIPRCLQKEMATYRHWSVFLWQDPDDVSHCQILSPDNTEWRLISATLCRWRHCFVTDQLWFMTHIREEEEVLSQCLLCSLWAHCRTLLRTAIVENPKAGSGPMYSAAAACFTSLPTSSLSTISLWPGKLYWLWVQKFFR